MQPVTHMQYMHTERTCKTCTQSHTCSKYMYREREGQHRDAPQPARQPSTGLRPAPQSSTSLRTMAAQAASSAQAAEGHAEG